MTDEPDLVIFDELSEDDGAVLDAITAMLASHPGVHDGTPDIDLSSTVDLKPHFTGEPKGYTISVRIPDTMARLIDVLIAQEGVPHANRADFMRDAAYYYAQALVKMAQLQHPVLRTVLFQERLRADAAYHADQQRLLETALEDVHDYLVGLLEQAALQETKRMLEALYLDIAAIPSGHWRDVYRQAIDRLGATQAALAVLLAAGMTVDTTGGR